MRWVTGGENFFSNRVFVLDLNNLNNLNNPIIKMLSDLLINHNNIMINYD